MNTRTVAELDTLKRLQAETAAEIGLVRAWIDQGAK